MGAIGAGVVGPGIDTALLGMSRMYFVRSEKYNETARNLGHIITFIAYVDGY